MAITIPDEKKPLLVEAIQNYFLTERDEEIGELQASFFLDFVLKEIGPSIYNQAVIDAQSEMQRIVADLDITLHEPEGGYSAR